MIEHISNDLMLIGELSVATGVSTKALRYYEREGLLSPDRMGRLRAYSRADLGRVKAIRMMRNMGIGIADIRTFVSHSKSDDLGDVFLLPIFNEFVKRHIVKLKEQEHAIGEQLELTRSALNGIPSGNDPAS